MKQIKLLFTINLLFSVSFFSAFAEPNVVDDENIQLEKSNVNLEKATVTVVPNDQLSDVQSSKTQPKEESESFISQVKAETLAFLKEMGDAYCRGIEKGIEDAMSSYVECIEDAFSEAIEKYDFLPSLCIAFDEGTQKWIERIDYESVLSRSSQDFLVCQIMMKLTLISIISSNHSFGSSTQLPPVIRAVPTFLKLLHQCSYDDESIDILEELKAILLQLNILEKKILKRKYPFVKFRVYRNFNGLSRELPLFF